MARVPISLYLSILAGIFVLFNHYASSETGDVALNKVTGAADRFYTLIEDTALAFQHGASRLETALCGFAVNSALPHDAAEYLRVHYCHAPPQDSEGVDGTSDDRHHHGGYGGSDLVSVCYQPPIRLLVPWTDGEGLVVRSPFSLDRSSQRRLSQVVWDRSSETTGTMRVLLLRAYASWWWFRVPLRVTGALLAAHAALSALGYLFGASVVLRVVFQVYAIVVADFLQCIEWEAQRRVLDIGVVMAERAYGIVEYASKRI